MIKRVVRYLYLQLYNVRRKTRIRSNHASIHAVYGNKVLIDKGTIVEDDVKIGDYSYVNKYSSVENCVIGKYCSISSGVYICPFEHNLVGVSTHPRFDIIENRNERRRPVHIGNDVLISLNSIILEGVTIGDGAVVAAGAVVTRDIKPYEVVGGVPAKHIKYRFTAEEIETLKKIRWWDWDEEQIEKNKDAFSNVQTLYNAYISLRKKY